MAGFEGLIAPQSTEGSKTTDGKNLSSESSSIPKSGPSLFDSMLAQAGGKAIVEGETGEQAQTSQNQKTKTSQSGNATTQVVSTDGSAEEIKTSTGTKTASSGTSLFDKMVSQSKEQTVTKEGIKTQTSPKGEKVTTTKEGVQNTTEAKTNTKNVVASAKSTYTVSPVAVEETTSKTQIKAIDSSSENQKIGTKTITSNPVGDTVTKTTSENKQAVKDGVSSQTTVETNPKVTLENKGENIAKEVLGKTINNNTKQTAETKNNNLGDMPAQKVSTTNTSNTKTKTTKQTALNGVTESKDQVVKTATTTSNIALGGGKENKVVSKQETPVSTNSQNIANPQQDALVETTIASSQTEVLKDTKTQALAQSVAVDKTNKKLGTTELSKQTVDTNLNNKPTQTAKVKTLNSDTKPSQKKSLADQLIAGATATAAQTKSSTTTDKQGVATNGAKVTQNTTTPLNNTNLTQKDTVLSSAQTDNSGLEAKVPDETKTSTPAAQTVVTKQAVETKIDTKTTEQNIVDKKLENKSLDIKSVQKNTNLDNLEQDKVEKLTASTTVTGATVSGGSGITNEDLANQLATIRDSAKGEVAVLNNSGTKTELQNTSIKKDDLLNQGKKQDNTNNLLDKMVKESTEASKGVEVDDSTLGTKDQFIQKDLPLFATAGYLHDQKRRNDIANMMKKYEGVQQAQNAKGVSDIKKSAATLELNATETEVVKEAVQKEEARVQNTREGMLKRLAFDNHLDKKLHNNTQQVKDAQSVVAKSSNLTNTSEEKVVEVVVSNEAAQTIENRIIGARQSLRTMMSDVARQMAQNYRPPLTAFRINLNPSGLGNIAVMIKSEQNNGVNISLNMSNASTHDTLVDNQAALRAALTRNFENTSSFNLNFGMQQDNNNQSNQNQDGKSNQNSDSQDRTVSANNLNEESIEEVTEQQASYM